MSLTEWEHTCEIIPNGVQTLSKMPEKHVKGVYPFYLERGDGAHVWDYKGNMYIDYPLGLGPVLFGHNSRFINSFVLRQLSQGTLMSLPHKSETLLAEEIVKLIPCAEMVRFLKTGSEATSAAVRIARAYTNRDKIVACGYHGWHDWYAATTTRNAGIPKVVGKLTKQIQHNNMDAVREAIDNRTAAIILEPYIYGPPDGGYLEGVISHAHAKGALVIFDEVITGIRTRTGSAQRYFNVTPDLTCLSKALGNGYPIAAVCGKREFMSVLESNCFVSSTFGADLIGIAAATGVMRLLQEEHHIDRMWANGAYLQKSFNTAAVENGLEVKCIGFPCRTFFTFPTSEHKSLFWQMCLRRGVLFGYAQFVSTEHSGEDMSRTVDAMNLALRFMKGVWDDPVRFLDGPSAQETLRSEVKTTKS